jgi:hypothetical protein
MMNLELQRYIITGGLLFGAYTAYTCPCSAIGSCHLKEMALSIGIPTAVLLAVNWDLITSSS